MMSWHVMNRPWRAVLVLGFLLLVGPAVALAATRPTRHPVETTPHVLLISHEGGRSIAACHASLAWGADAVEVDLVTWHGQLYVSHNWLSPRSKPDVPSLVSLWPVEARAPIVEFDLKESSPSFNHAVLAFFSTHHGHREPQFFASSRSLGTLRVLQHGAPEVFRFLSIGYAPQLQALEKDPAIVSVIDGVSIDETLLTPQVIKWLHGHHLLIFAWTVDNPTRAEALMKAGVDGITTDRSTVGTTLLRQERAHDLVMQRGKSGHGAVV